MQDWLLPIFMIAGQPKASRAAILEQLVPVALPGPTSQRLAFAAIGAERQLKRQALTEQGLVEDAIKAAKFTKATDLAAFPALDGAFKRLPVAVQAVLFPTGTVTPATATRGVASRKGTGP